MSRKEGKREVRRSFKETLSLAEGQISLDAAFYHIENTIIVI